MKKGAALIFKTFVLFTSIMLLAACAVSQLNNSNQVENSSQASSEIKMASQHFKGVTFNTPADWEKKESDDSDTVYYYPDDNTMMMVSVHDISTDESMEDKSTRRVYVNGIEKSSKMELSNESSLTVDGNRTYAWDIESEEYDRNGKLVALTHAGKLISFLIATEVDYNENYLDTFKEIVGSIKLKEDSATSSSSYSKSSSQSTTSKWDEATKTLTTSDGVLKIDRIERTTDYEGKPAIKVYFTLTNNSSSEKNAQMLFMSMFKIQQVSANTSNDLHSAILGFSDTEENHLRDNINSGGTISGYYPYSLENETDPLRITLMENYFQTIDTYNYPLQ